VTRRRLIRYMAALAGGALAAVAVVLSLGISMGPVRAQEGTVPGDTPASVPSQQEILQKEAELGQIRKDLEEKRQEAADLAGREQDLAAEIERINEELSINHELLSKLGQQKSVLMEDLDAAQIDLMRAQASVGEAGDQLGGRLRGIYKFGRGQAMEVILTSKSFADLAERIYYLSVVADHDRKLLDNFEGTVEAKRVLVEHIEGKKARLEETEMEATREAHNLALKKEERDALVGRLKDRRYYYEKMARDLQDASRNLEEVLGKLGTAPEAIPPGAPFAGRIGKLVWPCEGEVVSDYGIEQHPKFGTIIKNNGIDIMATAGAGVRAVAAGTVSFAGPLSGLGNCVIVDHGGGYYTLYGRLETVSVGTGFEVAEGDRIGTVGETSAPEGPLMHFEIRQGKKPLDPGLWLLR
jgi:septal ring factor EnvC (AmiA/AmiB activator)